MTAFRQPKRNTEFCETPLFAALPYLRARCVLCLDTGIWRNPSGVVCYCLRCQSEINAAAKQLQYSVFALQDRERWIDPQAFDLARILTHYTKENPCKREQLEVLFFAEHPDARQGDGERKINSLNETLRKVWLLPVGSSKHKPYGHWIITNAEDLFDWQRHASSAPITHLATIHRLVKANRQRFAGQTKLDFTTDLNAEIETRIAQMETENA